MSNSNECLLDSTTVIKLPLLNSGKVRDIYEVPGHDDKLLFVMTDRMSAFDVVMDDGIPGKGTVLTKLSLFWFDMFKTFANHLITANVADYPESCQEYAQYLVNRSMLVRKANVLPLEFIVRGRLTGSFLKAYNKAPEIDGQKAVYGFNLPAGLMENDLIDPIMTPSTKAEQGEHDENISATQAIQLLDGDVELYEAAESMSIYLFKNAAEHALKKNIVIADTKFELGLINDKLILIDEVLTPDSSRFWPADKVVRGKTPPSYDKQFLRDYLNSIKWNKTPPPPTLPQKVIGGTQKRYKEALWRLTSA